MVVRRRLPEWRRHPRHRHGVAGSVDDARGRGVHCGWRASQCRMNAAFVTVVGSMARLQMVGHGVCHWGATTGRSCGVVQTIHDNHGGNKCGPFENEACEATWVRVTGTNLECDRGDSGGPWFTGGTAWGTMVAGYGSLPSNDCIFMSIGFITEMGLVLKEG